METSARVRYPTDEDIVVIGHIDENTRYRIVVYMIPITDAQDSFLREEGSITIKTSIGTFNIEIRDVYLTGMLDLTEDSDVDFLRNPKLQWCNNIHAGSFIPRNYDYETNTGDIIDSTVAKHGRCATVETFDNIKMFLFGHARLGYPDKVCVFRKTVINSCN